MSTLRGTKPSSSVKKEVICKICSKTFKRRKDLKSHSVIHLEAKPYKCSLCAEAFKHKASLKRHSLIHTGEKPFACRICGKSFRQKGSLNEHLLTHTGEKPHVCEVCSLGFRTRSNYLRHLRKHLEEKPYICNICGKGFNVTAYLKRHYETHQRDSELLEGSIIHEDLQPNEISLVESHFKSSKEKQADEKPAPNVFVVSGDITQIIDSETKVYPCKICNKEFIGYNFLIAHALSHIEETKYTCSQCSESFTSVSTFCKHKITHLKPKIGNLTCVVCGDYFNTLEALQSHLEMHARNLIKSTSEETEHFKDNVLQKRYICKKCNKTFRKEIEFMHHSLLHKHRGPFECDICYNKTHFETLIELHAHYSVHDEVPCVCYNCNESAETDISIFNNDLEQSIYRCNKCHKCFHDRNLLKKHYSFHRSRRPCLVKL